MAANNLRELAKKGDPKVIAQIIGHTLQKKGIDVQVTRENDTLSVFLESDQVRNQQTALVDFIQQGMTKLEMIDINKVKVLGVMPGETSPIWNEEIVLRETAASVPDLKPDLIPDMDDDAMGLDDDEFDNDFNDDEPEEEEFNDDDQTIQITDNAPAQKKSLPLVLLLLPLLLLGALVALHFTGIYRLPFLAGDQATTEPLVIEPSNDAQETPAGNKDKETPAGNKKTPASGQKPTPKGSAKPATTSPAPATSPVTSQNPWRDGINWAMKAATQAQTAKTKIEWNLVADDWGKSVTLLKQVPQSDPNYAKAQQKITEYQNNQAIAKKKVQLVPN
jgi:cytoskeletal protein RodZ